jgi:translation initiation factor 1
VTSLLFYDHLLRSAQFSAQNAGKPCKAAQEPSSQFVVMRPEPKKRLDTQPAQPPLAGLGAAFSEVRLPENLPAGPTAPAPTPEPQKPLWKMGRVVLRREKAHRGGKTVIVIDDFATHLPLSVIETVAKKVRAACGCGGTVKDRRVEIQGDQPARIRAALEAEGFEVAGVK